MEARELTVTTYASLYDMNIEYRNILIIYIIYRLLRYKV